MHSKEPSQSLYKNSFHCVTKEVQKPPRIDKLTVRKFDLPTEDEIKYMKFPELKQAKINQSLEGYKQVGVMDIG